MGEPVGNNGNAKGGPGGGGPPAVAVKAGQQALDRTGLARHRSCPPARQPENQRHEPWMRPPMARLERRRFARPRPARPRPQNLLSFGRLGLASRVRPPERPRRKRRRSEEHTSALQSLMRISYAVFCLNKKKNTTHMFVNNNTQ